MNAKASADTAPSTAVPLWSDDGKEVTFIRDGCQERVARFVSRLRTTLPVLAEKLPAADHELASLANAQWLSRDEYQGPLRDQAFQLLSRQHFIQDLSSGTTGEPVVRFNNWNDELSEQLITRRVFALVGLKPTDRVVCLEIGAPEISTFYFRAMAELGVRDRCFLHVSTDFQKSIEPLAELDPTVILTVPGIIARCAPRFFEMYGRNHGRSLRAMIHYAEPLSGPLRQQLSDHGVPSFSFYGTTEVGGIAGECSQHAGLHVQDDWIFPTLRDVEQHSPGRYRGTVGWTAMHFEAQPLLKYDVGDVVEIDTNPCPCGAPGVRLQFLRRSHDVVSVYGLKFSYRIIERALSQALGQDDPLVQVVLTDAPKGMGLTVRVCRDHDSDPQAIVDALYQVFEIDEMIDMGYLTIDVEPVERSYFDQRKMRRVVDQRSATPFL
jgi:phenylacetate-CoA ligase